MKSLQGTLIDGHTHIGADLLFYLRGHYPYALDWASLVKLGRPHGVERFVVFPMVTNLSLGIEAMRSGRITTEGAMEATPYAFENRRLMVEIVRLFPEEQGRALPLWMIDPQPGPAGPGCSPAGAERGIPVLRAKIQATVLQSFIRDLLGPGSCLLEHAEEKGLPVLIHTSVHPDDPWSAVDDILDVVKAWPGVRFCLAHSCRFDEPSLDEVAGLPNAWFDCSAHRIHCMLAEGESQAIATKARRCNFDYRDPKAVLQGLAEKYPTKLIWGSDAPFQSYVDETIALHSTYEEEAAALLALGSETADRVARTNTLAFLSIKE